MSNSSSSIYCSMLNYVRSLVCLRIPTVTLAVFDGRNNACRNEDHTQIHTFKFATQNKKAGKRRAHLRKYKSIGANDLGTLIVYPHHKAVSWSTFVWVASDRFTIRDSRFKSFSCDHYLVIALAFWEIIAWFQFYRALVYIEYIRRGATRIVSGPYLGRKSAIANGALKRPFFRVTSIVDLQRRIACERLEANVAGSVAANACKW